MTHWVCISNVLELAGGCDTNGTSLIRKTGIFGIPELLHDDPQMYTLFCKAS